MLCAHRDRAFATVVAMSWMGRAAARRPPLRRLDLSQCEAIGARGRAMLRPLTARVPMAIDGLDELPGGGAGSARPPAPAMGRPREESEASEEED